VQVHRVSYNIIMEN